MRPCSCIAQKVALPHLASLPELLLLTWLGSRALGQHLCDKSPGMPFPRLTWLVSPTPEDRARERNLGVLAFLSSPYTSWEP